MLLPKCLASRCQLSVGSGGTACSILRKTTMVKVRFLGVIVMVLWVMLDGPSGGRTPPADRGRRVVRRAKQLAPLVDRRRAPVSSLVPKAVDGREWRAVKLFVSCEDVGCSFESRM